MKGINDWTADEFAALNLGDTRLNRRAEKLLGAMYIPAPHTLRYAGTGRFGYHRRLDVGTGQNQKSR